MEYQFPMRRRVPVYPNGGFLSFRSGASGARFIHHAQDFRGNYEPVYAPAHGIATQKRDYLGGNMLNVVSGPYRFEFAHLSKYVKLGEVSKGDQIAVSGNSGQATTGAHLHLAIYYNGTAIDPLLFNFEGDENMYALSVIRNPQGEISIVGKGVRLAITYKVFQRLGLADGDKNFIQVSNEEYNSIPAGDPLAGSQNLGSLDQEEDREVIE